MNNDLQRLWLDQLLREHADICYQYRLDLRPPIFELSNGTRQLGCWLPSLGVIRLSRNLITTSSWDIVLMVLKHEMAHQLCSEQFGSSRCGHDGNFRRACEILGVLPPYNRADGDLVEVVLSPAENRQTEAGRKTIAKIDKLLSLAGSDNEHEAALAMQRAREIMQRHNLDMAALEQQKKSACIRVIINTGSKQMPGYRRAICAILRDHFFVQVICSTLYDPSTDNSYKTIELLGRAENVPVAEHCYHFLEQQLGALWQKNQHRFKGNRRTARNSYYLGLLHGFSQKMSEQREPTKCGRKRYQATDSALIIADDRGLQEFICNHFPRLVKRRSRGTRIYNHPYATASVTGRKLILHKSIREQKKGVQGILGTAKPQKE